MLYISNEFTQLKKHFSVSELASYLAPRQPHCERRGSSVVLRVGQMGSKVLKGSAEWGLEFILSL